MNLVIFDCDGVLVDSEPLVSAVESDLLAEMGVALTPEEVTERFIGLSEADVARHVAQQWGTVLDERFSQAKAERLAQLFAVSLRPMPGMVKVLEGLGRPKCVASSSNPARVELSLAITGLSHYFGPHVFTASMVERGKPAPDLFLLAASVMGASPASSVVVEDSPFGVKAGVAAGMQVIGFTGGGHCGPTSGRRLAEAGADVVVGHADLLRDAIDKAMAHHRSGGRPVPGPPG